MKVKIGIIAGCLAALVAVGTAMAGDNTAGATYIGVAKCKMCHKKQHKTWQKMKHAVNFSVLQGDEKKNPECLKCHTTGFGKGGYDAGKDDAYNKKFENVQCEACHGPGSLHMKSPMKKKKETINRKVTTCSGCHNPHRNRGEEAKKKRGG